jgi:hydrogenase-4 component E
MIETDRVSYAVLAEASMVAGMLSLSAGTGSVSLATMLSPSTGAGAALLAAGLFVVLLAENCRVPFDDPNTHLELTMIHEVMVLDHSGPPLAVLLHGAALKLLIFSVLLAEAVLPIGELAPLLAAATVAVAVLRGRGGDRAGRVAHGPARVPPRAAAADDGVPVLPVRAAHRLAGRRRVSGTLNLLVGLAMGLNLVALASSRLPSIIRAAALQGMVLGVLPLLLHHQAGWPVWFVAAGTIAIKGFVIPGLLRRALRAARIDREVEPLLGFVPSLLLGAAATIAAVALTGAMPLRPEHARSLLVPKSFATVFCGFLLLINRAKAISQVCGYLVLKNGIYLLGLLLIGSTPFVVEAGILLDLTVAVFVIGIIVDRIQREFDTLGSRQLTALRE